MTAYICAPLQEVLGLAKRKKQQQLYTTRQHAQEEARKVFLEMDSKDTE